MIATVLSGMQGADPGKDMVDVFGGAEFDRSPSWWDRFTDSVGAFFDSLSFSWLGPVGQFLVWVLLIAVAAALVWLLVRALVGWRPSLRRGSSTDTGPSSAGVRLDDLFDPDSLPPPAAFTDAGDHKRAILLRYRQLVLTFMDRRLVAREPGRTTGELRSQVATAHPQVAAPFGRATDIFEVAWFSNHPSTAQELAELDALASELALWAGGTRPAGLPGTTVTTGAGS